jgi:hypothetical protein
MKMVIGKNKLLLVLVLGLAASLSGCASSPYRSEFICSDSRGAACMPMDRVDKLIASGEIELFTKDVKKCRGRACKNKMNHQSDELPTINKTQVIDEQIKYNKPEAAE